MPLRDQMRFPETKIILSRLWGYMLNRGDRDRINIVTAIWYRIQKAKPELCKTESRVEAIRFLAREYDAGHIDPYEILIDAWYLDSELNVLDKW